MFTPKPGSQMATLAEKSRRALDLEVTTNGQQIKAIDQAAKAGCPRDLDNREWKAAVPHTARAPRRRLMLFVQHQARLNHFNAVDHLLTMARSLGSDGQMSALAPTSLSRVVCEAAVRVNWLLDTAVSFEERITRGAAALYSSGLNELKAANEMAAGPEQVKAVALAQKMLDGLGDWLDKAQVDRVLDRNQRNVATLQIPSAGVKVPVELKVGPEMKSRLPEVPTWYSRGSGVAHSATWRLRQVVSRDSDPSDVTWEPDLVEIAEASIAAIHASALIIKTFSLYFGLDPAPFVAKSRSHAGMIEVWKANWIGLEEQKRRQGGA
jgi:hypothetical protein